MSRLHDLAVDKMDHTALTTLRTTLQQVVDRDACASSTVASARTAASSLPVQETLRELVRLPKSTAAIRIITGLGVHPPFAALRRKILSHDGLLAKRKPDKAFREAMTELVEAWTPLCGDDEVANGLLSKLAVEYPPRPAPPSPYDELSATRVELDGLHARLESVMQICGGDASGHTGLAEEVRATLAEMKGKVGRLEMLREGLRGGDGERELEREVRRVEERKEELEAIGFEIGDDSDSEDWEEAVEVEAQEGEGEGEARRERREMKLPEVNDWAAVMRGEEGRDVNRMILERFEQQQSRSSAPATAAIVGSSSDQAQPERTKRSKKAKTTARQRLSKKLGIKKPRKPCKTDPD